MFKKYFFISLLTFSALFTIAQVVNESPANGYFSLNNFSGKAKPVLSSSFNPAALANLKNSSAGIYGEQRFLLKELSYYSFALALQTKPGNFGVNGYYSGSVEYNSMSLGGAYGRKLGEKADIGIQFDYSAFQLKGYGKTSFVNVQIGGLIHLSEQLHAGMHIKNLAGFRSNKQSEKLKTVYTVGLGYDASDKFFAAIAFQKEEDQQNDIHAMVRYDVQNNIGFKAGISTQVPVAYGGIIIGFKSFTIDVLSSYHPQLGITPGLALQYNFQKGIE